MGGTVERWNALEKLEREENERNLRLVRDRVIHLSSETYGHASAYDNAVMIAGYAAFFALWSGVSEELSPLCRLVTAALMGISLMFYIGWQIGGMLVRQKYDAELAKALALADEPESFNQAWEEISRRKGSPHSGSCGFGCRCWSPASYSDSRPAPPSHTMRWQWRSAGLN